MIFRKNIGKRFFEDLKTIQTLTKSKKIKNVKLLKKFSDGCFLAYLARCIAIFKYNSHIINFSNKLRRTGRYTSITQQIYF